MVGFGKRRAKKLKTAGSGKRVVAVFGPPGCGVSTALEVLASATETPVTIVPYVGPESIRAAELALESAAEVVFLDVDNGLFGPADVQALVDERLVYAGSGAIVRLYSPDDDILHRTASRGEDRITPDDLTAFHQGIEALEHKVRAHTLTYFMVPNYDLVDTVSQLALRAGIDR